MSQFSDRADFQIRFQPFQLYPDLPHGDSQGVDKLEYFKRLRAGRGISEQQGEERSRQLRAAWAADGLTLAERGGRWGNSFDAQRLISLARKQGCEDAMVEEIYTGNHEKNQPLSEWSFLIAAAERAGVSGAEALLQGDEEAAEVAGKIKRYKDMGLNAVPVIVVNDREPMHGAPDHSLLARVFEEEIRSSESIIGKM